MSRAPHSTRHDRLSALFLDACEIAPGERESFLRAKCGDDPGLLKQILEMLPYDHQRAIVDHPLVRIGGADVAIPEDQPSTSTPSQIGEYQILGVLGQGGMGIVYRARQRHPDRVVALKVVQYGLTSASLVRRFQREAALLGRLHHPGIAQIYEAGTADTGIGALPYYAMELITGRSLLSHVRQQPLSLADRLGLLAKVCDAVQHAHEQGIVHRDLKPGNILVEESTGQPKILDFGVARITDAELHGTTQQTREGQILGTLPYMSPEQLSGDSTQIDCRSDVYSLGVIAYELLTHRLPHDLQGKPVHEAARIVHSEPTTRISVLDRGLRGDVETMVTKAMEKDPVRRYQSAAELSQDIRRYLNDQPLRARPPSAMYRLRKFTRRHRALVIGTSVAMSLLVAAVFGTSYGLIVARAQRDEARRAVDKAEVVRQFFLSILATPAPGSIGRDVKVVDALLAAEDSVASAFPDQPEIRADLHAEIAATLAKLDESAKAQKYAREALRIRRLTLGETHIDTVKAMNNLGYILLESIHFEKNSHYREARDLLDTGISVCKRHHADRPADLIALLSNRATLAWNVGSLDEAEQLTREGLALAVRTAGERDEKTIHARQNLAMLLNQRGQAGEAESELRQVAKSLAMLHGDRHPQTLKAHFVLAKVLMDLARYEDAEKIFCETLPVAAEVFGHNHVAVIRALNNFAFSQSKSGHCELAVDTYRDALRRAETSPATNDFLVVVMKDSLALLLKEFGQLEETERLLRDCVAGLNKQRGPQDASTLREMYKLVDVLIRRGNYDEAITLSLQQRAVAEEHHAADAEVVVISRAAAARALLAADRSDEARPIVEACLRDCPPRTSDEHYLLGQALEDLAASCEQCGFADAAAELRQ